MADQQEPTSYEQVRRAIEFEHPTRVPVNFDENRSGSDTASYGDDFLWLFVEPDPAFRPARPGANELGVVYDTVDASFGQAVVHPLADLADLDDYVLPDFGRPERYRTMTRRMAAAPDRYALAMFPHFLFLTGLDLLGFENFMMELAANPAGVARLLDRLTDSCLAVVDACAARGVHGLIAIEDLGLQDRLILPPALWRELFKPRYARIIERAHDHGLHVFIHSCGYLLEILNDLIGVGFDVLQLDQQDNMGLDRLAAAGRGRVCFFCPVDIQSILVKADNEAAIERRTAEMICRLGTAAGGFIAKTYPQPDAIGIPRAATAHMCAMFRRYGDYTRFDELARRLG